VIILSVVGNPGPLGSAKEKSQNASIMIPVFYTSRILMKSIVRFVTMGGKTSMEKKPPRQPAAGGLKVRKDGDEDKHDIKEEKEEKTMMMMMEGEEGRRAVGGTLRERKSTDVKEEKVIEEKVLEKKILGDVEEEEKDILIH
jgi:hypothetical protein